MIEGSMTGRPYGGANERPEGEGLPGEREQEGSVTAAPEQSPGAAQGPTQWSRKIPPRAAVTASPVLQYLSGSAAGLRQEPLIAARAVDRSFTRAASTPSRDSVGRS